MVAEGIDEGIFGGDRGGGATGRQETAQGVGVGEEAAVDAEVPVETVAADATRHETHALEDFKHRLGGDEAAAADFLEGVDVGLRDAEGGLEGVDGGIVEAVVREVTLDAGTKAVGLAEGAEDTEAEGP